MRTANPVLNERTFTRMGAMAGSDVMTIQGTVTKTAIMLFLVVISASYTWNMVGMERSPAGWMMGGMFGAFIMAIATMFKPTWGGFTAPAYAILEGLFLGGISAMFEPNTLFGVQCHLSDFWSPVQPAFAYQQVSSKLPRTSS